MYCEMTAEALCYFGKSRVLLVTVGERLSRAVVNQPKRKNERKQSRLLLVDFCHHC